VAVLYLMVGLPGSGKTTRAMQLAAETGALRLTPDEWQTRLFGNDMHHPDHDRRHDEVEALMWEIAAALLRRGADVVLDFGFWSRTERAEFARRARSLGAECRIDYQPVTMDELERRIKVRNAEAEANHYVIPLPLLQQWAEIFEPPGADELSGRLNG
jgi:predicted kinase